MKDNKHPYDQTRQNYDEGIDWHIKRLEAIDWSKQMDRFTQALKGKKVLDVGCGSGRDIRQFLDKGLEVEGVDYSHEMVARCRKRFQQIIFYEGDMTNLEMPDASYDGLWACASILNLKKEDVGNALKQFKRVLKPNGILFVSVKEGKEEKMVPDQAGQRFFSFFSLSEIKEKIESAGFQILHKEVISHEELTGKSSDNGKPAWICLHASVH